MNMFEFAIARAYKQRAEQAAKAPLTEEEAENLDVLAQAVESYAKSGR